MAAAHSRPSVTDDCHKFAHRAEIGLNVVLTATIAFGIFWPFNLILYVPAVPVWCFLVLSIWEHLRKKKTAPARVDTADSIAILAIESVAGILWLVAGWYATAVAQLVLLGIGAFQGRRDEKLAAAIAAEEKSAEELLRRSDSDTLSHDQAWRLLSTEPEKGFARLKTLADEGVPEAMCRVGWCYEAGYGTEEDPEQAEQWYWRAYERGSNGLASMVTFYLGSMYYRLGLYDRAHAAWSLGAGRDYAPSIYYLGGMYHRGTGVRKDLDRARALYGQAVALGHVYAKWQLGHMCRSGVRGRLRGLWLALSYARDMAILTELDPKYERRNDASAFEYMKKHEDYLPGRKARQGI